MADLPIENLLPRAGHSIYKLFSFAANRALELSDGKRCLAENSNTEKFTTMALEEIAQGKIEVKGISSGKAAGGQKEDESAEGAQEDQSEEASV